MSEPDYDFLREDVAEPAAAEPVAETVETPVAQAPVSTPEATTAPAPKEAHVPLPALMAERDKRQQEEAKRKELERRLAELEANKPEPPKFYENPELAVDHRVREVEARANQRLYAALEAAAREAHPDYDEVIAELTEQAQSNPALAQQVFSSPNPATAAYRLGKQLREMKAMQDPAAYRAQVEAEIRAQIAAEQKAKEDARKAAEAAIPPELSTARATKDVAVVEDDSLDSILAQRQGRR
jgi:hypothetical protein